VPPRWRATPRWAAARCPREADVLRLIALGNTNTETAELLGLSVRTVETHRGHILEKTGCRSRAELVLHAIHSGLLDREFEKCPQGRSALGRSAQWHGSTS
jgi:DNA-binding CsgD family transcriptional regulator